MIFDFLKRKRWEDLGHAWTRTAIFNELVRYQPNYIFMRDRAYRAIPEKDFEKLIFDFWFPRDLKSYAPEIFDCDDFTICFMAAIKKGWAKRAKCREALAFGYVEADLAGGGRHAFAWALNPSGGVTFYEPQTGQVFNGVIEKIILMEI